MCKGLLGSAWYFAGTTSDSDSEGGIVMDNTGEVWQGPGYTGP